MRGIRLGRLFGVRLEAHWTVLMVVVLVTTNLGGVALPAWHPDWSTAAIWVTAVVASVLFLVSILLHELAHAVVGRAYGIPVRRITLFVFGGVTDIEREPPSPKVELFMAAVGPLTSIALGVACSMLAAVAAPRTGFTEPAELLRTLGPVGTLLAWLGPLNLLLGIFNLVPGFPLDGGRVLRAGLWSATGDLQRATRIASRAGQLVGVGLIAIGVAMMFGVAVPFFGRGVVSGLWLMLIGWFLNGAAVASYQQLVVRDLLAEVTVARLMRTEVAAVAPVIGLEQLVDALVLKGNETTWPVVEEGRLLGVVSLVDLRRVARQAWSETAVAEVMTPRDRLVVTTPEEDAFVALRKLGQHDQLPVVDGDRLVGVLRRTDIARWLAAQGTPVKKVRRERRIEPREPPRAQV